MIKFTETIMLCCVTKVFHRVKFLKLVKYFKLHLIQALPYKHNAKLLYIG